MDLVIAHGTGTPINDACEDRVFTELFRAGAAPAVTATKGSIGHTLGASGAMDVIAACEALRRQRAFAITGARRIDPAEVGEWKWIGYPALIADMAARPDSYTVWFRHYVATHREMLARWMTGH